MGGVKSKDLPAWKERAHALAAKEMAAPYSAQEQAASAAKRDALLHTIGGMLPHHRAAYRDKILKRLAWLKKHPHRQHEARQKIGLKGHKKEKHPKGPIFPHANGKLAMNGPQYRHNGATLFPSHVGARSGWSSRPPLRMMDFINYAPQSESMFHPAVGRRGRWHAHEYTGAGVIGGDLKAWTSKADERHWAKIGGGSLNVLGKVQRAMVPQSLKDRIGDGHTTMRFPGGSAKLSILNITSPIEWPETLVANYGQSDITPLEPTSTHWPGGEAPLNKELENRKAGQIIRPRGPLGRIKN